ncbi:dicarboxylate/amino acid:cation symporter [bacterium]|nr:dicarboxylate/amino acid:cation symporter [bacterium]
MKLHTKILLGLVFGLIAGIIVNQILGVSGNSHAGLETFIANVTDPIGQIFLRLLFMIVVPLVFASLALGVANLGDLRSVGRIGIRTLGFFIVLTTLAVILGLILIVTFEPGKNFDAGMQSQLMSIYGENTSQVIQKSKEIQFSVMTFVDMALPRNILRAFIEMQMLPIIIVALLFGIMMTKFDTPVLGSTQRGLTALNDFSIRIVDMAMKIAPYAVPCLVFGIASRFGVAILKPLGLYVALVFSAYFIHTIMIYSILLRTIASINPWAFFKAIKSILITAFSTSSSNATLPTTIRVTEENLSVTPNIAGFVLPLGATVNMNGTALYEGMTVLFLAEVFGVELTIAQQALVVVMAVLTAIGTAGIPGGSLPLIVLVMQSVGVPPEGIGIILGVDRILDMGRTTVNVTGDVVTAACIAKLEGQPAKINT